jgi:hypothetical protein
MLDTTAVRVGHRYPQTLSRLLPLTIAGRLYATRFETTSPGASWSRTPQARSSSSASPSSLRQLVDDACEPHDAPAVKSSVPGGERGLSQRPSRSTFPRAETPVISGDTADSARALKPLGHVS